MTAVVGLSGAGKSTLSQLLLRLYDPQRGHVTIDGIDIRTISLQNLSDLVGIVSQECFLFNDTVRYNLQFARPDATTKEIEAACRIAQIWTFIARLPHGLDTVIGEKGMRMSGGERQRLSIARTILKNPRVLVLDEATSHLDSINEHRIQQEMLPLLKNGRTSVVIAHRLSTILMADTIMMFKEGRLVERGTHGELLKRRGKYAKMFATQFAAMEATGENDKN